MPEPAGGVSGSACPSGAVKVGSGLSLAAAADPKAGWHSSCVDGFDPAVHAMPGESCPAVANGEQSAAVASCDAGEDPAWATGWSNCAAAAL
jgi:hypothetical protein